MFFMEHTFHLKEWPTSYDYLDLGTDRHLKKKKKKKPVSSSRKTIYLWPMIKFKLLSETAFWKTCIYHHELDNFLILKDFSDAIGGDINKCYLLIL